MELKYFFAQVLKRSKKGYNTFWALNFLQVVKLDFYIKKKKIMIFLFSKDMFTSVHFHIFPGLLDLWIILLFFQRILSIEYYKINVCLFVCFY